MQTHEYAPLSDEDYERLEVRSPIRHEYVNGEIFAMTGGTLRHNTIALNMASLLRAQCAPGRSQAHWPPGRGKAKRSAAWGLEFHLRTGPCRTFINDVRVKVARSNAYYYTDVVVACPRRCELLALDSATLDDALLIAEVLSPSTEATDRREKLLAYRTIPSLAEYALISSEDARVEIHRRHGDIGWHRIEYSGPEDVEFASVALTLPMRDLYEGVPIDSLLRGPGD